MMVKYCIVTPFTSSVKTSYKEYEKYHKKMEKLDKKHRKLKNKETKFYLNLMEKTGLF